VRRLHTVSTSPTRKSSCACRATPDPNPYRPNRCGGGRSPGRADDEIDELVHQQRGSGGLGRGGARRSSDHASDFPHPTVFRLLAYGFLIALVAVNQRGGGGGGWAGDALRLRSCFSPFPGSTTQVAERKRRGVAGFHAEDPLFFYFGNTDP
jgi:hypothetical protein